MRGYFLPIYIIMYIADFILVIILMLIMGRSNNSHKNFPRIFRIELLITNKGVYLPGRGTGDVAWAYLGGISWGYALLINSFFSLWIVATDTLVSFDVTLML